MITLEEATMRTMRADALRNEAEFLPESVDELAELRRAVIDAGHPASVANGLVGWLVAKAAGERDVTASDTRSRYRRILAELDPGDDEGGPGRGRPETPAAPARALAPARARRFRRYARLAQLAA